ncbi:MAG: tol-pal system protein YbgF [Deltaproteobacteria bacterium]|nr:tol-pal system protein YbgF [Deltaproteobacteria bacterium]
MKTLWVSVGVRCAAAAWLGAVACTPPPSQVKVDELNRTIASLKAQNVEQRRQIEELENQVFILGDKADSRSVNEARVAPPRLPKVTLTPGQSAPAPDEGQSATYSFGEDSEVEYVGEAAKPSKSRPVLRLVGNGNDVITQAQSDDEPVAADEPTRAAPSRRGPGVANSEPRRVPIHNPDGVPLLLYKQSLDHLKASRHADAAAGFREFLRRFPQHDYADNAQYWLAECYYDLKDFVTAVREFRRVVDVYPQGNKVPDALLKAGLGYLLLGNEAAGRGTLTELQKSFPTHTAAKVAAERMSELDGKHDDAPLAGSQSP